MAKPPFKLIGDNPRYERWRWQVFGITWLTYFGYYLTRKTFSVAKIGMEQDPAIDISRSDMPSCNFPLELCSNLGRARRRGKSRGRESAPRNGQPSAAQARWMRAHASVSSSVEVA